MQTITRKLIHLRRTARWLLVGQRLAQIGVALAVAAIVLGVVDYLLRLPGWLRLAAGVLVAGALAVWLVSRLGRAVQFRPTLSELALRVERLFPDLAGRFASAVEFADQPERYADPQRTHALATSSVEQVQQRAAAVPLTRLLKPVRPLGWAGGLLAAAMALGAVALAAPEHSRIAAQRWLSPLASPAWPKRTNVVDAVDRKVWALDSPVRVEALVKRGHEAGMRVSLHYRMYQPNGEPGPWRTALMAAQPGSDPPRYQWQRTPRGELTASLAGQGGTPTTLEYTIAAGDDRTPPRKLNLVPRPRVTSVTAELNPPDYARTLVQPRSVDLLSQTGQVASVSALTGSSVRLRIALNKPIRFAGEYGGRGELAQLLPGLAAERIELVDRGLSGGRGASARSGGSNDWADRLTVAYRLRQSVSTRIALTDRFGIENSSDRQYRFETKKDKTPTVTLTEPAADREVLPQARVSLAGRARDDVGVRWLRTRAEVPEPDSQSKQTTSTRQISEAVGRRPSMATAAELDLANLDLNPGQQMVLTARARDVFELNGKTHEPVTSAARTLTIIDRATLLSQVREALGALRRQAIQLDQQQARLSRTAPAQAQAGQRAISRRLDSQRQQLADIEVRLQRNRLDEPALAEQLTKAGQLVEQAKQGSKQARTGLRQSEQAKQAGQADQAEAAAKQARRQQANVRARLSDLASLLDRGQDAMALKLQLDKLTRKQQELAQTTRELLPRTVGRSKENLPENLKQQLNDLAQKQQNLTEQAQQMVRQMQQTARSLEQSQNVDDKAAAKTLSEAARIAQRQGLNQQMQQASKAAKQNRLSQAGGRQAGAARTMQQMQDAVDQQKQQRQEMLRRRLKKLAQLIEQLIDAQQRQRQALKNVAAAQVAGLAPQQSQLRRRTMAAQQHAGRNKESRPAVEPLDHAVTSQGEAMKALRQGTAEPADKAEAQAVNHLKTALQRIREARQQAQQNEKQKQRQKLRRQYQQLAKEQQQLLEKTQPLAKVAEPNRQQQATLRDLGDAETDLREKVEALSEKVNKTIVFQRMHQQVSRALERVAKTLNDGEATEPTLADQQFTVRMLKAMAEALKPANNDKKFAGRQGGGGGGGGGGQRPSPVPPYAELKLLRAGQAAVADRTAQLAEARDRGSGPAEARLRELAGRQQGLAELGHTLLQQVQQRQQQQRQRRHRRQRR